MTHGWLAEGVLGDGPRRQDPRGPPDAESHATPEEELLLIGHFEGCYFGKGPVVAGRVPGIVYLRAQEEGLTGHGTGGGRLWHILRGRGPPGRGRPRRRRRSPGLESRTFLKCSRSEVPQPCLRRAIARLDLARFSHKSNKRHAPQGRLAKTGLTRRFEQLPDQHDRRADFDLLGGRGRVVPATDNLHLDRRNFKRDSVDRNGLDIAEKDSFWRRRWRLAGWSRIGSQHGHPTAGRRSGWQRPGRRLSQRRGGRRKRRPSTAGGTSPRSEGGRDGRMTGQRTHVSDHLQTTAGYPGEGQGERGAGGVHGGGEQGQAVGRRAAMALDEDLKESAAGGEQHPPVLRRRRCFRRRP